MIFIQLKSERCGSLITLGSFTSEHAAALNRHSTIICTAVESVDKSIK